MEIKNKEFIVDSFIDEYDGKTKWFVLIDRDFETEQDAKNFVTVIKLNLEKN